MSWCRARFGGSLATASEDWHEPEICELLTDCFSGGIQRSDKSFLYGYKHRI